MVENRNMSLKLEGEGRIKIQPGQSLGEAIIHESLSFYPLSGLIRDREITELPALDSESVRMWNKFSGTQNGPGKYEIIYRGWLIADLRPESYEELPVYTLKWIGD